MKIADVPRLFFVGVESRHIPRKKGAKKRKPRKM